MQHQVGVDTCTPYLQVDLLCYATLYHHCSVIVVRPRFVTLQVLHDQIVQFTDAGAATGSAVVTFDTMSLLAPRGRFDVEMYLSSLKLTGQVS